MEPAAKADATESAASAVDAADSATSAADSAVPQGSSPAQPEQETKADVDLSAFLTSIASEETVAVPALPAEWKECLDTDSKDVYFWNTVTGEVSCTLKVPYPWARAEFACGRCGLNARGHCHGR